MILHWLQPCQESFQNLIISSAGYSDKSIEILHIFNEFYIMLMKENKRMHSKVDDNLEFEREWVCNKTKETIEKIH